MEKVQKRLGREMRKVEKREKGELGREKRKSKVLNVWTKVKCHLIMINDG